MNRQEWFDKYAWVWDAMKKETKVIGLDSKGTKIKGIIVNIDIGSFTPFFVSSGNNNYWCESVEPLKTKTIVKPASEIIEWLYVNKYKNDGTGFWKNDKITFLYEMFDCCGKEPDPKYTWLPDWLMEVEE